MPDVLIYGMLTSSGLLSKNERTVILDAIGVDINIVIGLHKFLTDDPEFSEAGRANGVEIKDVRKPAAKTDMRSFRHLPLAAASDRWRSLCVTRGVLLWATRTVCAKLDERRDH